MNDSYFKHQTERMALGIPPLPLNINQVSELVQLIRQSNGETQDTQWLELLVHRVPPGVDPAAKVKAEFLASVAFGETSTLLTAEQAVKLLGTMLGGWNVSPLIELLEHPTLAMTAAKALCETLLVFDASKKIVELSKKGNVAAQVVTKSWCEAEWFQSKSPLPKRIEAVVFKIDGEINTDDLSPAVHAVSRADIPFHALSMGERRFPGGLETIAKMRAQGMAIAFVGDVIGTGSSRKSAVNSLLWHIGEDIAYIPNKRRGGVVIGGKIAPIFFNTLEDAGSLPIECDVSKLETGLRIVIEPFEGKISDATTSEFLSSFCLRPTTLKDEYRAGGRTSLIIGQALTNSVRSEFGLEPSDQFIKISTVDKKPGIGFTLAQKIIGRACGLPEGQGVYAGASCSPHITTAGSQDTTGPMTRDELMELACLKFSADLVMQSFCHTAAYPKPSDQLLHQTLPQFIVERGGVALRPGDGIIHSWINRMLLPDTLGVGADSHTRFPIGISFPAGSGLVAFAAALGSIPLEVPQSVLVKFKGSLRNGITWRDVVNAIPWFAIKAGLLTVEAKNKKNIFNGRILEIEGLENLSVAQAFELSCASAERSSSACTVALEEQSVVSFLKENIKTLQSLIDEGYQYAPTLEARIQKMRQWLNAPSLLRRDMNAEFAACLEIDMDEIIEPLLACPNNPDDVRQLNEVSGDEVQEVFIGSCMTHIEHYRLAAKILRNAKSLPVRLWITPPTRLELAILEREGVMDLFRKIGARCEIPGCSLCMGNQAQVADGTTVISTSTRNFDNRLGNNAKVYLGSAELAAMAALLGRLPSKEEYFEIFNMS